MKIGGRNLGLQNRHRQGEARDRFRTRGSSRYQNIDFNDGTWRIQIPAKLHLWNANGSGTLEWISVTEDGDLYPIPDTTGLGEIVITRM